jgi:hypothetical protein
MDLSRLKRLRKGRIILVFLVLFFTIYFAVSDNARRRVRIIFSSSCRQYNQSLYSNRLADRIVDYSDQAKSTGIKPCRDERELKKLLSEGKLVRVTEGRSFRIDRLTYSYSYLTPAADDLLREIGRRFREKTKSAGLNGSCFIITSMTRTTEKMKGLRRNNSNASPNSPHLNGNAFDISYIRFTSRKFFLTACDKRFFKEILAEVIVELRREKRCWATYEKNQSCFHVIAR